MDEIQKYIILEKIGLSAIMLFEVILVCWKFSAYIAKQKTANILINCFAAGIFISMGIVHILPEALETFYRIKPESEFPVPALMSLVGFIFVLFIS